VLELPKLDEALDRNDEPNLVLWGRFLSATTDAELDTLAIENPVLKQAKEALETLSDDPSARVQAEMREMALLSYKLDMGKVWHDGVAKGEARGRAEGEARGRAEGEARGRAEGEARGRAEGEARGRAEGEARGRAEGKEETLRGLLSLKFGDLPEAAARRLENATEAELDRCLQRLLTAGTLEEVLTAKD
jgi:hypothetical protein